MSMLDLQNINSVDPKLLTKFKKANASTLPSFDLYKNPLERGLWILWVAKDKLKTNQLSADQIVLILREVKEVSVKKRSIINAFNRVPDKVHRHNKILYEIMKPGKDHLRAQAGNGPIAVFQFEPGKPYSSKNLVLADILGDLKGELKIVDPYCGSQTLEVMSKIKNKIKFMTRIDNLKPKDKNTFLSALKDFKTEYKHAEFGNYACSDIHDRYIITTDALIILGYSIKNLGDKESFAIMLDSHANKNIYDALCDVFNRRWKSSTVL